MPTAELLTIEDTAQPAERHRVLGGAVFNAIGWIVPVALALAATPYIVHELGVTAYGTFTLFALVAGSMGPLSVPLGQATIKYVAEARARGDNRLLERTLATSLSSQALIGLVAGAALFQAAPWLAGRAFNVPAEMVGAATFMFRVAGVNLFLQTLLGVVAGVPQALQRYDIYMLITAGTSLATTGGIVAVLWNGGGLTRAVIVQPIVTGTVLLACWAVDRRLLPGIRWMAKVDVGRLFEMLRFGGWVFVNQLVSLLTFQVGRAVVGIALDVQQLAYFSIANSLALYLQAFGAQVAAGFMPVTASILGRDALPDLQQLYLRAMRLFTFVIGGLAVGLVALGPILLRRWMGAEFAAQSAPLLAVLAVWGLLHALGALPYWIANGSGQPRVTALFAFLFGGLNLLCVVSVATRGPRWIAVANLISTCIASPLFIGYVQSRILKLRNAAVVKTTALPFLLGAAATVAGSRMLQGVSGTQLPADVAVCLATAALYGACALAFGLVRWEELTQLAGRFSRMWMRRGGELAASGRS